MDCHIVTANIIEKEVVLDVVDLDYCVGVRVGYYILKLIYCIVYQPWLMIRIMSDLSESILECM